MKIVFKTLFMISLVFLISCHASKDFWKEDDPIKQLVVDHAANQKKRNALELVAMNAPESGKQGFYYIHYITVCPAKIEDVRKLIVDVIESFIECANQSEEIKDSLTVNNIILNLGFVEEDGSFHEPPSIAYAYAKNGTIHYCYYDNLFGKFISYDDVQEPYLIAKNIVKSTR